MSYLMPLTRTKQINMLYKKGFLGITNYAEACFEVDGAKNEIFKLRNTEKKCAPQATQKRHIIIV